MTALSQHPPHFPTVAARVFIQFLLMLALAQTFVGLLKTNAAESFCLALLHLGWCEEEGKRARESLGERKRLWGSQLWLMLSCDNGTHLPSAAWWLAHTRLSATRAAISEKYLFFAMYREARWGETSRALLGSAAETLCLSTWFSEEWQSIHPWQTDNGALNFKLLKLQ